MNENPFMDSIAGAKILSERFGNIREARRAPEPFALIQAVDALPLFHWAGVEPCPRAAEPVTQFPVERRQRWRRRRKAG